MSDTSSSPFLLPTDGSEVGDPSPVYWDGVWHLYTLRLGLDCVLHFTSIDLVTWNEHEPAMVGTGIATGTVLRHDGLFYLFYTDAGPQTIRLVTSDTPWRFDITESKLVAEADQVVYSLSQGKFRDCYVFCHAEQEVWWMLVEATSDDMVAVGLFKSADLLNWTQHDPIFRSDGRTHGSCPQLIEHGGRWHLSMLDYPTWYYLSDSPYGPWELGGIYHTKRLTAASRWASDGTRWAGWGFFTKHDTPESKNSGYGGPLGVGRELVFSDDGVLGVRPLPELTAAIRQSEDNEPLAACFRELSGPWEHNPQTHSFVCANEGVARFDLPEGNPNYYFEADIALSDPRARADIIVRTNESIDTGYRIALEPAKETVSIRQVAAGGGIFDEREYAFYGNVPVQLQVFICDGQIEAFVGGKVSLSARILDCSNHGLAVDVTGGGATIGNPLLHYFRSPRGE